MHSDLFIPVILGTAREGRRTEAAARFVLGEAEKYGVRTELIDPRDYLFGTTDDTKTSEMGKRYAEKIAQADGLIIVSPEYNHGYPGELKLLLDSAYKEYARKPVGICGAGGGMGGARMVEQLRLVAIELALVPIHNALYFPKIKTLFQDGVIIDPTAYTENMKKFLDELVWYARALKVSREQ